MKTDNIVLKVLGSPFAVMLGILLGFIIGFRFENAAGNIGLVGKMYLAFLNMCILPIIITAVITGLAKIIRTPEAGGQFPVIILGFAILLFIPSIAGLTAALVGKPGSGLGEAELGFLGGMMAEANPAIGSSNSGGIVDLIAGIVPWNFFESLSKGQTMSIVFACIFIGMGAGFARGKAAADLVRILDAVSDVFNLLFKWAVYFLPIGVCCVIADHMAGVSPAIFSIMVKYLLIVYVSMGIMVLVYILVMWRFVGGSFHRCLKAMKDPLLLAFTVDSSFIAIKSCLDSLEKIIGVERKTASLVVPFTMVANRQGKIFIFAFTSIFLAQIYGADPGVTDYATVIIGSSLAGMAAPGSGAVLAPMAAVVISAIGVPPALAFVIFTINGPIVDRVLSVLTVQGSCLLAALASKGPNEQKG